MHGVVVESVGSGIALGQVTGTLDLDEMAQHFKVSRSLIREALRTLAAKGMVVARQRTGTRVTPTTDWAALDDHVIRWRAAGPDRFTQMHDSLEIRERLEPLAARRMAMATPGDAHSDLTRATRDIEVATRQQDHRLMLQADTAFHRALYEGSGSDLLAELGGTVHACLRVPDFQQFHRWSPHTASRHAELAEAVLDGDAARAEAACTVVISQTMELFTQAHRHLQAAAYSNRSN